MFNAAQKNVMSRKLRSKRLRHSLKPLFKRHDFFMLVYKSHDLRPVFKCHDFLSPIFHSHACLRSYPKSRAQGDCIQNQGNDRNGQAHGCIYNNGRLSARLLPILL